MGCEHFLPKARSSLLAAQCVRDWSGILCGAEREMGFGNGDWEMGFGNGNLGAGRNEASKDIAESPTASPERPI